VIVIDLEVPTRKQRNDEGWTWCRSNRTQL